MFNFVCSKNYFEVNMYATGNLTIRRSHTTWNNVPLIELGYIGLVGCLVKTECYVIVVNLRRSHHSRYSLTIFVVDSCCFVSLELLLVVC